MEVSEKDEFCQDWRSSEKKQGLQGLLSVYPMTVWKYAQEENHK